MLFVFALVSTVAYALHTALLTRYVRGASGLVLMVYRNLSLIVTMAPVLFFVRASDFFVVLNGGEVLWWLVGAGFFGAMSGAIRLESYKYLPIGLVQTMNMALKVIFVVVLTAIFLKEYLTIGQIAVGLAIIAVLSLVRFDSDKFPHLEPRTEIGYGLVIVGTLLLAVSLMFFGVASREVSPLLAGYLWETFTGLFALIFLVGHNLFWSEKLELLPRKNVWPVVLIASLAVVGTSAMGFAVNYGAIGLVQVIGVSGVVFATIFANFLYGEKLNRRQGWIVAVVLIGVVALNFLD